MKNLQKSIHPLAIHRLKGLLDLQEELALSITSEDKSEIEMPLENLQKYHEKSQKYHEKLQKYHENPEKYPEQLKNPDLQNRMKQKQEL